MLPLYSMELFVASVYNEVPLEEEAPNLVFLPVCNEYLHEYEMDC